MKQLKTLTSFVVLCSLCATPVYAVDGEEEKEAPATNPFSLPAMLENVQKKIQEKLSPEDRLAMRRLNKQLRTLSYKPNFWNDITLNISGMCLDYYYYFRNDSTGEITNYTKLSDVEKKQLPGFPYNFLPKFIQDHYGIQNTFSLPFPLRSLKIREFYRPEEIVDLLGKLPLFSLNRLDLSHNWCSEHDSRMSVLNALRECSQLESLDLSNNYIGGDAASVLAETLEMLPQLNNLNLSSCTLGPVWIYPNGWLRFDESVVKDMNRLALALGKLPQLKSLDLRYNYITNDELELLKQSLPNTNILSEPLLSREYLPTFTRYQCPVRFNFSKSTKRKTKRKKK